MDISAATVVVFSLILRCVSCRWISLICFSFFFFVVVLFLFIPISDCLSIFICLLSPIFYLLTYTITKIAGKIKQPFVNASIRIKWVICFHSLFCALFSNTWKPSVVQYVSSFVFFLFYYRNHSSELMY